MAKTKVKQKVLLMDDNPVHRLVIFDGLTDAGFEVKKASNIEQAEKILETFTPDLFILDIVIEAIKGRGIQFSRKIRENLQFESTPILFISAHLDELNKEKYFPEGDEEHLLPKPFDFDQLVNKLRELLR